METASAPQLIARIEGALLGPTLFFVQGWPDDLHLWDGLVFALRDRYRCVRINLPNYPGAVQRRWGYSHDEIVEGLASCIRSVSPQGPVTLIAHDWGALWSYRLHDRHPELIARLVALDIGPTLQPSLLEAAFIGTYQAWLAAAFILGGPIGDAMTRGFARLARSPQQGQAVSARLNYPYFYTYRELLTGQFTKLSQYAPKVPMMLVYGTQKPARFHTQRWIDFLRSRPDDEVVELNDSDHWVTQHPKLNAMVQQFLDRTTV